MTDEVLIQEFDGLVQSMAYVALGKLRKPCTLDHDDLCQIGRMSVLESYHRWWNPNKPASLKTFFTTCLRMIYTDIVHNSYSRTIPEDRHVDRQDQLRSKQNINTLTGFDVLDNLNQFLTKQEKLYVTLIIETKMRYPRHQVREKMNLTYNDEVVLREAIREKLDSCKGITHDFSL